jgi:hypothetical protein
VSKPAFNVARNNKKKAADELLVDPVRDEMQVIGRKFPQRAVNQSVTGDLAR